MKQLIYPLNRCLRDRIEGQTVLITSASRNDQKMMRLPSNRFRCGYLATNRSNFTMFETIIYNIKNHLQHHQISSLNL